MSHSYKQGQINLRLNRRTCFSPIDDDKKSPVLDYKEKKPPKRIEIHQEHRTEMEKQLYGFDLNYNFGPCIGLSRLERWDRAAALGLEPPQYIRKLLLAAHHRENRHIQKCLFKE
ncbi:DNA polymerase delta, subunit 4-domain-containing protein [Chlamydoabsidia padenii]|nr:DNA polymerase delta, subunit 4-domain-containing protein [Chlamydoabsidia padenii]